LSVDPVVNQSGQPYVFAGGDPVNSEDVLGLLVSSGAGETSAEAAAAAKAYAAAVAAAAKAAAAKAAAVAKAAAAAKVAATAAKAKVLAAAKSTVANTVATTTGALSTATGAAASQVEPAGTTVNNLKEIVDDSASGVLTGASDGLGLVSGIATTVVDTEAGDGAGIVALFFSVGFWKGTIRNYTKAPLPPLRMQAAFFPATAVILSGSLVIPASHMIHHHHVTVLGVFGAIIGLAAIVTCLIGVVLVVSIWFGLIPKFLIPPPMREMK
jgi:hypothetical protein